MAKTRKRDTGESPRGFAAASEVDRPGADLTETPTSAPFEGATTEDSRAEAASNDAWAPQSTGDTTAAAGDERDRIAARAYEIYLERGGSGGDAMDDWLAAEREFSNGNRDRHSGE
jgi:Protein of unknown function (DUF2934)